MRQWLLTAFHRFTVDGKSASLIVTDQGEFETVAIGIWLYDGTVRREIRLLRRPSSRAYSRWVEDDQTGQIHIDQKIPRPATPDDHVYYIDATAGGEFKTKEEALEWAGEQPWAPVAWTFLPLE